jgi:valyl-tRNA synthetase
MIDKKYDHTKYEHHAQQKWKNEKTYVLKNTDKPLYSIDTPPPSVSGSLHIGHIFSYTQTDIIARYKRMSGYNVFYPFGFDDNGLPTEKFVEKQHNIKAHELSRPEFISLCLQETSRAEETFKKLWQKIGLSVDWQSTYSTIDQHTQKISQESFIRLYEKGFIYRKESPILYCINCRTAVAQAELDDVEKPSVFYDITFTDTDNNPLTISTTRPELLPSCVALVYHPSDKRYAHLKGTQATVPVYNYTVNIIEDELVDPEKGSGLVMICTFGDKTDVQWYQKHDLPYRQSVGIDGKWTENTGPLQGMRVASARKKIVGLLKESESLIGQKDISHVVNVHERCKKDIEYLVLPQWFLRIIPYKKELLEYGNRINWHPHFMKARYENWVENINWDWCLSRQRFYGIPFPAWHCNECNHIIVADKKQLPIDPQVSCPVSSCPKCSSENISADTDVMDTWNTSSLTPYICKSLYTKDDNVFDNQSTFLPMSMRPQAHDIIRTWAFYTVIKSWMHDHVIPWKDIVISGHALSNTKDKISKSQGNSPLNPDVMLANHPADAIRYWTASASLGYDTAFSPNQIKIGQKLLVKLWNAFRFAHSYLQDFTDKDIVVKQPVNQWIQDKVTQCFTRYHEYFKEYQFGLALDTVEKFFWADYCDNYIELIKHQLMNPDQYSDEQVYETQWTLYHVGLHILQLYAPFVPHVTESLYELLYKDTHTPDSLHTTEFDDLDTMKRYPQAVEIIHTIQHVIDAIRKLKSEHKLSLKTDLHKVTVHTNNDEKIDHLTQQEDILKGVTHTHIVEFSSQARTGSDLKEDDDGRFYADVSLS